MSNEWSVAVEAEIDAANAFVESKQPGLAVLAFAKAREMVHDLCDQDQLKQAIARETTAYVREREVYTELLLKRRDKGRMLTIFADSLGLPRPNEKTGENFGADACYSWMLADALPGHRVTSICQRFFTTDHILEMLLADPQLGAGSDVVIHVGLNDCANRMFLENERIALSQLTESLRDKMVNFSRTQRGNILTMLPPRHYVPQERFSSNLHNILGLLRQRKAEKILLSTIILPPPRSWRGTPGMNRNFASYNLAIMQAAHLFDAQLFDIDRQVWWGQRRKPLLDDGMHLSQAGHELFAEQCAALLKQPPIPA